MNAARLLIVDHADSAAALVQLLDDRPGTETVVADDLDIALKHLERDDFDAVIASLPALGNDGFALIERLRAAGDEVPVVFLAEQPSVEQVIDCMRRGAVDLLRLPPARDDVFACLDRVLATRHLAAEHELLRRQVERPYIFDDIIGTSPAMKRVFDTIERVADLDVPVLVIGETGTGKELVARSLHRRSRRAQRPFVAVDCGAIPENLLESEFFGHERGAFTGADNRSIGLLEFSSGGTFFLDELGELPLLLQAKLLRTLQEHKIRRVGGRAEIDIDVRVVAATGRDIEAMIASSHFRQDLYYRINVVRIELPPLRERGDDLGLLVEYFATRYSREMQRDLMGITPEAYQVLSHYRWPGNVRELQNVIRRAIALSSDRMIGLDDLPESLIVRADEPTTATGRGYFAMRDEYMSRFERQYLTDLLARHRGDVKLAAEEARLPRGTLYRLMKNADLDAERFRN